MLTFEMYLEVKVTYLCIRWWYVGLWFNFICHMDTLFCMEFAEKEIQTIKMEQNGLNLLIAL